MVDKVPYRITRCVMLSCTPGNITITNFLGPIIAIVLIQRMLLFPLNKEEIKDGLVYSITG